MPVADRGLHYGDALFETIALVDGQACLLDRHLLRLSRGCERLGIPLPDLELLLADIHRLRDGVERAVLKLIVTRGEGGRGYRPPAKPQPRRLLSLHDWPDYPGAFWTNGVQVRWCDTPLGLNPALAGIKHCNRLEQVMARAEWDAPDIPEGLMCDLRGNVIEGTQSNLFLCHDGQWSTPSLDGCGVAGVARALLIDLCEEQDMPVRERAVSRAEVLGADALLLTNALVGCWPVAAIGEHRYDPAHFPRELMRQMMEQVHSP